MPVTLRERARRLRHEGVFLGALPETRPAALLTAPFAGNPRHDHKLWVTAVVGPIRRTCTARWTR